MARTVQMLKVMKCPRRPAFAGASRLQMGLLEPQRKAASKLPAMTAMKAMKAMKKATIAKFEKEDVLSIVRLHSKEQKSFIGIRRVPRKMGIYDFELKFKDGDLKR